ncbi:MAG: tannase/feruloyl esterase family alpha/beta hydrolase [Variovorax sp.]|nr:MAG: tannase/feruloyl esterase family alpha/beta hydrolase [Variovorax sp.]
MNMPRLAVIVLPLVLAGCGTTGTGTPPQLAAANPGALQACGDLASRAARPGVVYTSATPVPAGPVASGANASQPAPAHCLVQGRMNERKSAVDGNSYAIGFEMRLPVAWNGRFFHQVNGGLDGAVVPALGGIGGGAPVTNALRMGFAVVSSDAGHAGALGPRFGLDPQARLDYGYNAVAQLTPVAKHVIAQAYGRGPDRSYIGGCSNGGRHAMVAAARSAGDYDGILAGNPGFNLPRAAVAQLYGAQQYARIATASTPAGLPDLQSAFTPAELKLVSDVFRESAMAFMSPPDAANLATLRNRGAKMMVYHGTSDPVFSSDDTAAWYERVQSANGGNAAAFARYFPVPGMNHCSGGPATDQFDMLSALVAWVERGEAPASVTATARGAGSNMVNPELPAGWSAQRTRPLCPWPQVARYQGGDPERASSFACRP